MAQYPYPGTNRERTPKNFWLIPMIISFWEVSADFQELVRFSFREN